MYINVQIITLRDAKNSYVMQDKILMNESYLEIIFPGSKDQEEQLRYI